MSEGAQVDSPNTQQGTDKPKKWHIPDATNVEVTSEEDITAVDRETLKLQMETGTRRIANNISMEMRKMEYFLSDHPKIVKEIECEAFKQLQKQQEECGRCMRKFCLMFAEHQ